MEGFQTHKLSTQVNVQIFTPSTPSLHASCGVALINSKFITMNQTKWQQVHPPKRCGGVNRSADVCELNDFLHFQPTKSQKYIRCAFTVGHNSSSTANKETFDSV